MVPPPGQKTFEGLENLKKATSFAIYANVVVGLAGLGTLALFFGGGAAGLGPSAAVSVGGGLIGGILQLAAFVVGLTGVLAIKTGRREFGPEHDQSVGRGWKLLIGAVLVYVLGTVVSVIAIVFVVLSTVPAPGAPPNLGAIDQTLLFLIAGFALIAVIGTFLVALALQAFIEKLMPRPGRDARSTFIVLAMAGAFIQAALEVVSFAFFPVGVAAAGQTPTNLSVVNLASIAAFVSIASLLVYRRQVEGALAGARLMVETHSFNPDAGAPA